MKRGIILFILMFLLVASIVSASTSSVIIDTSKSNVVDVKLKIMKYTPAPVAPGEYFDLWVAVETDESSSTSIVSQDDVDNIELEFLENYPFTLKEGEDTVWDVGDLGPGEQVIKKFVVRVADDAPAGDNELRFIYTSEDDPNGVYTPYLDINVQEIEATLNVDSIVSEPEILVPGKIAELDITVNNGATSAYKNIDVVLAIDSVDVPIVPYKSSKEKSLSLLGAGEDYTFNFEIIVEEDAEAGVYKIPMNISYQNSNGTEFIKQDTFGIMIGAEADLSFNLEDFDTFQEGGKGEIVVSVSNIGPTELKFMNIELLEDEDYVIIGANKEYLGNLDSDDFETSTYDIFVNAEDDTELNFKVTYKDAYNEEYEEEFSVSLPVYTRSEVAKYELDSNGTRSIIKYICYLLIILFIYFSYKAWRIEKKLDVAAKKGLVELIKLPFRIILIFRPSRIKLWPNKIGKFFKSLQ
ncbi:MAG: hypothetical protein ISS01_02415 [Nanoarchaeota archaeon]|nr:hypothetical protein [Nanoarchaeota archaeon]